MSSVERAQWLEKATEALRQRFAVAGYKVPPNVRVAYGWPSVRGISNRNQRIGECWGDVASTDGHAEIFVSPAICVAGAEDRILGTLAHELVHATVGVGEQHNSVFKRCAVAIGLTGKMTATTETDDFRKWAADAVGTIGQFPAGGINAGVEGGAPRKKQSTRLLKCACPACGYTARVTKKWICDAGTPICPADDREMEIAA